MNIRNLYRGFIGLAALTTMSPVATAFHGYCGGVVICQPCLRFAFSAHLNNPSGLVNPENYVPFKVVVTNYECFGWEYLNSEYGFYVFDENGCHVPNALILPTEFRRIAVPPRVSIIDEPKILLNKKVVQLGKRYALVVTLRGHQSAFWFTPFLEFKKNEGPQRPASGTGRAPIVVVTRSTPSTDAWRKDAPATIEVLLPTDAELTVDGYRTKGSGPKRRLSSPSLDAGIDHYYTLHATVERNGKLISETRRVILRAGEVTRAQFTLTEGTVSGLAQQK